MDPLDQLIGESPSIGSLRVQLRQLLGRAMPAARLPSLLLLGETGTGKGLLAEAIHLASLRASRPLVSVNCAAIPEALFEAELFGFVRGAFTDAHQAKPGLFQLAHQGTLFLDEIGLLPLGVQPKLLKAVEEGSVRRLGGTRSESVDVWIIAATGADLEAAQRHGQFREDLYYRLASFPFRLPPLRERANDVLLLAEHFLARACAEHGLPSKQLTAEARTRLLAHRWPGNVRELANVMTRAALLSDRTLLDAVALGLDEEARPLGESVDSAKAAARTPDNVEGLRGSLAAFERLQLLEALRSVRGNLSRAAALLGIPRNTLKYRIAKLGLGSRESSNTPASPRPASQSPVVAAESSQATLTATTHSESRPITLVRATIQTDSPDAAKVTRTLTGLIEKAEFFGGHLITREPAAFVAAFGLEPMEDAASRAADAALAIRTMAMRRVDHGEAGATFAAALHTIRSTLTVGAEGLAAVSAESLRSGETALRTLVESATPNTIVISTTTAPLIERRFTLDPSASTRRTHGEALLAGPEETGFGLAGRSLSPFVGRTGELELLLGLMKRAVHGQGQTVGIVGEPGAGKSRLLYEFRARIAADGVALVELRCAPHGTGVPYLPFVDLLRRELAIDDAADALARRALLEDRLDQLHLHREIAPYVARLLSTESDEALEALSPELRKQRTHDALCRLLLAESRGRPTAIFVEDLHWLDRASEEVLASLVDALVADRSMLLTTQRPGYQPPWLGRSHVSQVALSPLSAQASRHLVRGILPAQSNSSDVEQTIAARGEGNPFFLEELAWETRQLGDSPLAGAVPPTIETVLGSRIDRLPIELRRLLTTAAVIGREVSEDLLRAVQTDGRLAEQIEGLTRLEFLRVRPGAGHTFKHALTQEVAYGKLAAGERQALHGAVARAIEAMHAMRLEDVSDLLAHHYVRAHDVEKAAHYLERLGEQATQRYALPAATAAYEQALSLAEELPEGESRDRRLVELTIGACFPLILLGRFTEVRRLLDACRDRLERWPGAPHAARYHFFLGVAYDHTGDYIRAEPCCLKAIEEAGVRAELATIGQAYMILTSSSCWAANFRQGVERGNLALRHLSGARDGFFRGMAFHIQAWNHFLLGEFQQALDAGTEARRIGETIGDRRIESYGTVMSGWVALRQGDIATAIEICERAAAMAPDPLARAVVLGIQGEAYLGGRDVQRALKALEEALELLGAFGFAPLEAWNLARLAEAHLVTGDLARAFEAASRARTLAEARTYPYVRGLAERVIGRIRRAEGRLAEAVDWLNKAERTFAKLEARFDEAATRLDLDAVSQATGTPEAALLSVAEAGSYRLIGPEPTGFGLAGRRLSPFVGRAHEIALLIDRLDRADWGRGAVIDLVGDPGVGKSRLLYELQRKIVSSGVICVELRCQSHTSNVPYGIFVEFLKREWNLDDLEAEGAVIMRRNLEALGLGEGDSAPLLLILGNRAGSHELSTLSPQAIRDRTIGALRRLLAAYARGSSKLLLLVEDLHWVDRASEELLGALITPATGPQVFMIATHRPEYRAPWGERTGVTRLTLPPLRDEDSMALVRTVPGLMAVSESALQEAVERGEGNPFFLEEIAWDIARQGVGADLPASIQVALEHRIGSLSFEGRRLLEAASVVGRDAPAWLLRQVWGESVESTIRELVEREFLFERSTSTFTFKHVLTQEVTYQRLTASDRRQLHDLAGRAIESRYADRLDEVCDQLAHHFERSGDAERAVDYLSRLADRASRTYALPEAYSLFKEAIDSARALPAGEHQDHLIATLLERQSFPGVLLGLTREIIAVMSQELVRVERLGNARVAGPYYFMLALAYDHIGAYEQAAMFAGRAIEEARGCGDDQTTGQAFYALADLSFWSGAFAAGMDHGAQGVALLESLQDRSWLAAWWLGMVSWIRGMNALMAGNLDEAGKAIERMTALASSMEDPRLRCYGAWATGWLSTIRGSSAEGVIACRRAIELAPDPLGRAVASMMAGWAYIQNGQPTIASGLLVEARERLDGFGFTQLACWARAWLAEALVVTGELDAAEREARSAIKIAEDAHVAHVVGLARRALARALAASGALDAATIEMSRAEEVCRRHGMRCELVPILLDRAKGALARAERATAESCLAEAREILLQLGAPRAVDQFDAVVSSLLRGEAPLSL